MVLPVVHARMIAGRHRLSRSNGQSEILNDQMVDGLDNNERIIGTIGIRPSVESIAEVNVQTNTYSAENGRTAGGVVNVITKSGTNDFHGSAYEFFRNDVLDAYAFQFRPQTFQNQSCGSTSFGVSLGGPIFRDKTFFFADYEGFRQISGRKSSHQYRSFCYGLCAYP